MENNRSEINQYNPETPEAKFQRIKDFLMADYTPAEIDKDRQRFAFIETNRLWTKVNVLNHRSIDNYDFPVHYIKLQNKDRLLEFQITGPDTHYLAHLTFIEKADSPGTWDLQHRLVETGDLKISGTEFLKHAESYLIALAEKGHITLNEFVAGASQSQVIEWILKNDYQFSSSMDQSNYEDFNSHPEDYETFYTVEDSDDYKDEPVLFKKSEIDPDEVTAVLNPDYEDNKHLRVEFSRYLRMKGLMRVNLKKEINSDLQNKG